MLIGLGDSTAFKQCHPKPLRAWGWEKGWKNNKRWLLNREPWEPQKIEPNCLTPRDKAGASWDMKSGHLGWDIAFPGAVGVELRELWGASGRPKAEVGQIVQVSGWWEEAGPWERTECTGSGKNPETGGLKQRAELGLSRGGFGGLQRAVGAFKLDEERLGWGRKCSWLKLPIPCSFLTLAWTKSENHGI